MMKTFWQLRWRLRRCRAKRNGKVVYDPLFRLGQYSLIAKDCFDERIGLSLASPGENDTWLLADLEVDEDRRKGGIGTELLLRTLEFVRGQGGVRVWGQIRTSAESWLIRWYERMGFTVAPSQPSDGATIQCRIEMAL